MSLGGFGGLTVMSPWRKPDNPPKRADMSSIAVGREARWDFSE